MVLKKPLTQVLILIALLVLLFPLCVWVINDTLLSLYHKKYQEVFRDLPVVYEHFRPQEKKAFLPRLKDLNLKLIEAYRPQKPLSFLYQYDKHWQLLVSHSTQTASKHHLRLINQAILTAIHKRDIYFLDLGQHLLLKFTHGDEGSPLKYTVIGFKEQGFFRQKNFLVIAVGGLLSFLLLFFLVLFLFPWKNRALKPSIRPKEQAVPQSPAFSPVSREAVPLQASVTPPSSERNKRVASFEQTSPKEGNNGKEQPDPQGGAREQNGLGAPINIQVNSSGGEEKIRSFEEIFKYKQQLEDQLRSLAIVKEIKLASEFASHLDDFLEAIITLIHSKIPGDKVEIFLNHSPAGDFLTNSSFLNLRCKVEKDKLMRYLPEQSEEGEKLMLHVGEEGKALSHLHGVILKEKNVSTLSVPLIEKSSIIGAIRLVSSREKAYHHDEQFIMEKLAKHIARCLNNVYLFKPLGGLVG